MKLNEPIKTCSFFGGDFYSFSEWLTLCSLRKFGCSLKVTEAHL